MSAPCKKAFHQILNLAYSEIIQFSIIRSVLQLYYCNVIIIVLHASEGSFNLLGPRANNEKQSVCLIFTVVFVFV